MKGSTHRRGGQMVQLVKLFVSESEADAFAGTHNRLCGSLGFEAVKVPVELGLTVSGKHPTRSDDRALVLVDNKRGPWRSWKTTSTRTGRWTTPSTSTGTSGGTVPAGRPSRCRGSSRMN